MAAKPLNIRHQVALMLATPGIKKHEIAKALKVSTRTITRIANEVAPAIEQADRKLAALQTEIHEVISIKQRARKYGELAMKAKNEAVSLASLQRIDALDGIVTEKDRIRADREQIRQPQPIFNLPRGSRVAVTLNQYQKTDTLDVVKPTSITPSKDRQ